MNYSKSLSKEFKDLRAYQNINLVLQELSAEIKKILGTNLNGLYLFGSIVHGDFRKGSSDIDLIAIIKNPLDKQALEHIKILHQEFERKHLEWKERIECSYTPQAMLSSIKPPLEPRPYYGGGIFYAKADYGNEWIINNYLLYKNSVPLIGPKFSSLLEPINIIEVQKACIKDLFNEWEPKIQDLDWLDNSHYQSYLVLNLCRILYTVFCAKTASKIISAEWVKKTYVQWNSLIEAAENWEYGKTMLFKAEAIDFIRFVVNEIKKTELIKEDYPS
ncbi:MAG: DUF4111 domain-containing protein [Tatlockia sp.]|nr:DUF4111 domain-containing protein [Tatlockia sp.]